MSPGLRQSKSNLHVLTNRLRHSCYFQIAVQTSRTCAAVISPEPQNRTQVKHQLVSDGPDLQNHHLYQSKESRIVLPVFMFSEPCTLKPESDCQCRFLLFRGFLHLHADIKHLWRSSCVWFCPKRSKNKE